VASGDGKKMVIHSKAAFEATSPVAMYGVMMGVTIIRNAVFSGIFQYFLKRCPAFTAYCQSNAFASSFLKWRDSGRLILPVMDLMVQISTMWVMMP